MSEENDKKIEWMEPGANCWILVGDKTEWLPISFKFRNAFQKMEIKSAPYGVYYEAKVKSKPSPGATEVKVSYLGYNPRTNFKEIK
jgi:hypothetical protein